MLEGKVKIVLTDVKTGKKKTHEQHNLVTDNVQFRLNAIPPEDTLPLINYGMGTVCLFENAITGVSGNHFIGIPDNSRFMGYADRGVDISTPWKGSLNTAECVQTENSFTNVWDFSTSQLNGTIGSIALARDYPFLGQVSNPATTSNNMKRSIPTITEAIYTAENMPYEVTFPDTGYIQPLYYDQNTNFIYFVERTHISDNVLSMCIIGRTQYTMNYGVTEQAYSAAHTEILKIITPYNYLPTSKYMQSEQIFSDATEQSEITKTLDLISAPHRCWFGDKNGYVYIIQSDKYTETDGEYCYIFYSKFRAYDGSFDLIENKYIRYKTSELNYGPIMPSPTYSYTNSTGDQIPMVVLCDDKIFAICGTVSSGAQTTFNGYYLIDINSPANISYTTLPISTGARVSSVTGFRLPDICVSPDGIVSISSSKTINSSPPYTVYMDGSYIENHSIAQYEYSNNYAAHQTFRPYNCPINFVYGSNFSNPPSMAIPTYLLSTICNLSQTVTKTPAQTMKITYTIASYKPMYFSTQPHSSTQEPGDNITLTVVVREGSGSYSYQWQKSTNGTVWTDCTEATANTSSLELTVGSATTYYRCVATDSLEQSVTSLTATITVET